MEIKSDMLADYSSEGLICIAASSSLERDSAFFGEIRLKFFVSNLKILQELERDKKYKGYFISSYTVSYGITGDMQLDMTLVSSAPILDLSREIDWEMSPNGKRIPSVRDSHEPNPTELDPLRNALLKKYNEVD